MGVAPRKMIAVLSARNIQRIEANGTVTAFKGASRLAVGDTILLSAPKDVETVRWKVKSAPEFVKHEYVTSKGKRAMQGGWLVHLEELL